MQERGGGERWRKSRNRRKRRWKTMRESNKEEMTSELILIQPAL